MSTVERPGPRALPPLMDGERLDRATFHERYDAMPPGTRAELVGSTVFMASPQGYDHGSLGDAIAGWLFWYRRHTPGVGSAANATTWLGSDSEVQPDHLLRIDEACGGRSRIVQGFVSGPPELVIEIAVTSRSYDLGVKKAEYERAGVGEYLVLQVEPPRLHAFVLADGRFEERESDADGILRSVSFPGLWLNPRALFVRDDAGLIAALERGLATPEHAAFVARLSGQAL